MRSATCSTGRSSDTLMCSPRNIASRFSGTPDSSASVDEQPHGLVGDPVLGVVQVEPGRLRSQPLAAARVVGEQLAQVPVGDFLVVPLERLP